MPCRPLPVPATPYRRCHRRNFAAISAIGLAITLATVSGLSAATDAPLWFDAEGPRPIAREAVELLAAAPADGLEARDYHADSLHRAVSRAMHGPPLAEDQVTLLDRALTSALRRYLADLHFGRIDPQQIGADYSTPAGTGFDADSLLISAVADDGLGQTVRAAAPSSPQYASLREALARYRELVGSPAWQNPLPSVPGGKLTPGEKYAGTAALAERLRLLGDLPAHSPRPQRYEGQVVEAVRSFQERHALPTDGVIGKDTFEQKSRPDPAAAHPACAERAPERHTVDHGTLLRELAASLLENGQGDQRRAANAAEWPIEFVALASVGDLHAPRTIPRARPTGSPRTRRARR